MKVEPFDTVSQKDTGRPVKYPFYKLDKPGLKLIIDIDLTEIKDPNDPAQVKELLNKVRYRVLAALNQYKGKNDPTWETDVRIEGNAVVAYRIK